MSDLTDNQAADQAPKYRVSTVIPLSKADVLSAFEAVLPALGLLEGELWVCTDGSEISFSPSNDDDKFYVEFRVKFEAVTARKAVNFGLLPEVIRFCNRHGGSLKVRSGSVLPATGGVYSDAFHSRAFALTAHRAQHPRDVKPR